ncbi:RHS repeat protein [Microbacterium oxydans]|nr:RHS repeat protein [Microbacterium oxydans]
MTDPAGNDWTWTFDLLGNRIGQDDADSGVSTATYDLAGNMTSTTDARGKTVTTTYDELNRKTASYAGTSSGVDALIVDVRHGQEGARHDLDRLYGDRLRAPRALPTRPRSARTTRRAIHSTPRSRSRQVHPRSRARATRRRSTTTRTRRCWRSRCPPWAACRPRRSATATTPGAS